MEPISASLAETSALTTDPFVDDATDFIFGNGNTPGGATQTNTTTPSATASTSSGSGSSTAGSAPVVAPVVAAAPGATAGTSAAASGSPLSLTTILILAGGAFLLLHLFHK